MARGRGRVAPPRLVRDGFDAEGSRWRRSSAHAPPPHDAARSRDDRDGVRCRGHRAGLAARAARGGARRRAARCRCPPVSAGDPPEETPPARVPDAVLARLPVSRAALALPVTPETVADGGRAAALRAARRLRDQPGSREPAARRVHARPRADRARPRGAGARPRRSRHVVVLEPRSGRVLAYASTDPERFPPTRTYPAASLVKVITAATALDHAPAGRGAAVPLQRQPVPADARRASIRRAAATR